MFDLRKENVIDWTLAIDRHRDALLRMLAALLVLAGGGAVTMLPRGVRTEIYRVLRPAEAALRRLIVVVQDVQEIGPGSAKPRSVRDMPVKIPRPVSPRLPVFALFDTRKRFDFSCTPGVTRGNPNIRFFDGYDPVVVQKSAPSPGDPVNAERLCRRLQAFQRALENLPAQARRLGRWQRKRAAQRTESGKYFSPMRPGRPPGHRHRGKHPVDAVLRDCHALALYIREHPDHKPARRPRDGSIHPPDT